MWWLLILILIGLLWILKQHPQPKKLVISIEGNIGAGKTTLLNILKRTYPDAITITEPVNIWADIRDEETGKDLLTCFYEDKARWSYLFQNIANITRLDLITNALKQHQNLIILDRSTLADREIFAKMLHDSGFISSLEWSAYLKWSKFYENHIAPSQTHQVIYLKCSPQTALARIQKRNREAEKSISLEYLTQVHDYHETWLQESSNLKILVLDAELDYETPGPDQDKCLDKINNFIKNIQFQ